MKSSLRVAYRPKIAKRIVKGLPGVVWLATDGKRGERPFLGKPNPKNPDDVTRALDWIEAMVVWFHSPKHEEEGDR